MMKSKKVSKIIEMVILFVMVPGLLALSIHVVVKLSSVILALVYVGIVTYKGKDLSVIPQELIYRGFFYNRYQSLFSNKQLFSILNVVCFSWCHLFLLNVWVMIITVLGGILFVYTYEKEKNILWTIVEHSLYGNLVFTLGLGQMLAFPG